MNYPEKARQVIETEIVELQRLRDRVGESFSGAVERLMACLAAGRKLVICGVGKSGNIGRKLAATLNSTGAPAVLLNVGDALHGDLGVVNEGDLVITLSYSGETVELLSLLPHLKRMNVTLLAVTGGLDSTLARNADVVLDVHVEKEACPLNLAPTSSTTNMLVLCDALAMVLLEARGFQADDFARLHPGGSLGRALLTRVCDVMRQGAQLAVIPPHTVVRDALQAMTRARSGAAIVVDDEGRLAGVFTHGDFVRAFQSDSSIADYSVEVFMTRKPVTILADKLAAEVVATLERHRVDDLVVLDDDQRPVGLVDTQDLSRMKLV
ncbi:MAG: KpsF/GutQ family sugar-phosphate isomerase [Verrucomicrobiales bacterium]|nr:KpsF/GutQ family sugar-phosphate isomerase [Verrucomicrobiales bacterium]MCP5556241.1 KpsF/GutQ family sugar-phosphate isomerase [Verrucomicrobiaceae bacterium]